MATILTGYAYTKDHFGNAAAFNPDYATPILKDHPARDGKPETIVGYLLNKRHDAQGMLVDVLVYDDALAEKVRGFSVGTTKGVAMSKSTGKPLNEISICVGGPPADTGCTIKARKPADPFQVNLALYGQKVSAHFKLQKLAVAALRTLIEAHLSVMRRGAES